MEENIIQPQPPIEIPPSPTKPWLKIILFAGLGLILVSGLVFAGYQLGKTKTQPVSQLSPIPIAVVSPIPTPTIIITSTPNPTANWKTYKNTAYKYEIKYPTDWKVSAEGGEDPTTFHAPYFDSPCQFDSGGICQSLMIAINSSEYERGKNLEEYFGIGTHIEPNSIISKRQLKIDGEDALEIEYRLSKLYIGRENKPVIEIKAVHNQTVLTVQYDEQDKTPITELKYKEVLYQILSTFKFLD